MNSLNDKSFTISDEFKRKLIMIVKENPCVWKKKDKLESDFDSVQREVAWKKIERELGSPCLSKKIKATWSTLSETYFRIIFLKTIERNFEAPRWIFFHEMMFLYDHVKETIQNMLGGISPPLFKPNPNLDESKRPRCPCCIYIVPDMIDEPNMKLLEITEDDECDNFLTLKTENLDDDYAEISGENECENFHTLRTDQSVENYPDTVKNSMISVGSGTIHSIQHIKDHSPVSQQNEITNFSVGSLNRDFMNMRTSEVSESINITKCNGAQPSQLPSVNLEPLPDDNPLADALFSVHEKHTMELSGFGKPNSPIVVKDLTPSSLVMNTELEDQSKNLQEQEVCLNEQLLSSDNITKQVLTVYKNAKKTFINRNIKSIQLRHVSRSQIIQAVKANPDTYLMSHKTTKEKKLYHDAWSKVAEELGNVPLQPLKSRWKIIKTRYHKELALERYYKGEIKSSWEHFDEMEFLRPHMENSIYDNVEAPLKVSGIVIKDNKVAQIKFNDQPAADANENTNIQIAPINSRHLISKPKSKKNTSSNLLVAKTLPMLKNRPVTITGVKVFSNHDLNKNTGAPPPAKKLRKSTDSEGNNKTEYEIPRRQSLPHITGLTTEQQIKLTNLTASQIACNSKPSLTTEQTVTTSHCISKPSFVTVQPNLNAQHGFTELQAVRTVSSNFKTGPPVTNIASNFTTAPSIIPSTSALTSKSSLTSLQPAKTKNQIVRTAKPNIQNIIQTLDLTIDDDFPMTPSHALNEIAARKHKAGSNDDCVYTKMSFPPLDLTTDEDMDQNASKKEQDIPTKNKAEDSFVICLDDDSMDSYE